MSRLPLPKSARFTIPALASILYFSQGFPFGIIDRTLNLYLTFEKAPLWIIGLLSSIGIAWTLKVYWAPLVDALGTYRAWILGSLFVLSGCIATFAMVPAAGTAFWIAAIVLALASATQDIAVDAMSIRMTPSDLVGPVNSARVTAYRIALIAAGGGAALLADRIGWAGTFSALAALPLVIAAIIALVLPRDAGGTERHENPVKALLEWLARPGAKWLLVVVFLYRLGDSALRPMIVPFWAGRGFTAGEVGNVTTTLGMICTIAGAIAGGAFVARAGIFRGLLWLGALQMLSNLGYAIVAGSGGGRGAMYGAAVIETFCDGLGTAAFLSFLMFICERDNAATEFAMLSAVFAISRTMAGAVSGFFVENLGFGFERYFWLTALLALPGLAFLPLVRDRLRGTPTVVTEG